MTATDLSSTPTLADYAAIVAENAGYYRVTDPIALRTE